eukprot:9099766-Alexandrium_andersonii.AAC.1
MLDTCKKKISQASESLKAGEVLATKRQIFVDYRGIKISLTVNSFAEDSSTRGASINATINTTTTHLCSASL